MVQCLPREGMCVRSLAGELRSHRPRGSLRASTRKAGEPRPEKSPWAATKTQHNQNFLKTSLMYLAQSRRTDATAVTSAGGDAPPNSLRTKTSAPPPPGARRLWDKQGMLAPPPALPGQGPPRAAQLTSPGPERQLCQGGYARSGRG